MFENTSITTVQKAFIFLREYFGRKSTIFLEIGESLRREFQRSTSGSRPLIHERNLPKVAGPGVGRFGRIADADEDA